MEAASARCPGCRGPASTGPRTPEPVSHSSPSDPASAAADAPAPPRAAPRTRVLDVGAGEGHLAAHLKDRFEHVDLLDASPAASKYSRPTARPCRPVESIPP
ncbi:MAG: hypothetical protein EXR79_09490 [Myxococcales bacterium]|nr:hypothetical protein [Myxococcales bacterium]